MPRKPKTTPSDDLIDQLLQDHRTPEDIFGEGGLLKQLTKRLVERALNAELTHHLQQEAERAEGSKNSRNGTSKKTLLSEHGSIPLDIPRDRQGSFEPVLVPKHVRRLPELDEKIVSLYARGMSTRDIQAQLQDLYGVEVPAGMISEVTNEVLSEMKAWQSRPLESIYAVVYLDCLFIKMRIEHQVVSRPVYLAIGVNLDGEKDVLGMWSAESEGSKFWLSVLTELQNRGVKDILIASVDGLKGFPEAIEAVFPQTEVQLCMVHLVRYSLNFVSWKERKQVAAALKAIYTAPTEVAGKLALEEFKVHFGQEYPAIVSSWERNWLRVIPMFGYPPALRRAIYTTNAIESLNFSLRKVTKAKGSFPSEEAAMKLLYLGILKQTEKWGIIYLDWRKTLNALMIKFAGRIPVR
jgi:putative transposase